jgi:hypothetical protein
MAFSRLYCVHVSGSLTSDESLSLQSALTFCIFNIYCVWLLIWKPRRHIFRPGAVTRVPILYVGLKNEYAILPEVTGWSSLEFYEFCVRYCIVS